MIDLGYLCENIAHLSGLPVRIYSGGKLINRSASVDFGPDPAELVLTELSGQDGSIGFTESLGLFFGQIRQIGRKHRIIIGPAFSVRPGKDLRLQHLRELNTGNNRLQEYEFYLDSIPTFPIESFLQILCLVNYFLNNEKKSISDLITPGALPAAEPAEGGDDGQIHNTYTLEKELLSCITGGRTAALKALLAGPPTGRAGIIAYDELRQKKNTFICSATIASRAAIAGGLPYETAFTLSDQYIRQAERLFDYNAITRLNMDMLMTYARRVEALKTNNSQSRLIKSVVRYVNGNLGQRITLEDIASHTGLSRTYLCEIFRAETGSSLNQYIRRQKIDEACRLLSTTDQTIGSISESLGFSSQSYFQNVFKKTTGKTPEQYRCEPNH